MLFVRRALSCLLATGLAVPVVALAAATPASADTGVSGIALDSTGQDGLFVNNSSYHTPTQDVSVAATTGNGYQLTATSVATGSTVGTPITITPPTGTSFVAGSTYQLAWRVDATHASVAANTARACTSEGTLTVESLATDPADGHLTSLAASFAWRCTSYPSYLYGTLRYQATDYVAARQFTGSVQFGNAPVGQVTGARSITITSTGTAPLDLGTATMAGANPGDFAISDDTCSNTSVAAVGSCTLTLSAAPTATGNRVAQLEVPDNTARGMRALTVYASGIDVPSAPGGMHAETAADGVWLTWTPPLANGPVGATSYQVLRGTTADDLAPIGTAPGPAYGDALSDNTAAATAYVYAVKGVNAAGAGPASATIVASTPATATAPKATKVLTEDFETAAAPHVQLGRVLQDGVAGATVSADFSPDLQVTSQVVGDASYYAQTVRLTPPTGSFVAAGSYPLATVADETHAAVEITVSNVVDCRFSSGTVSLTQFLRNSTGAPAVVDLDVSGGCSNGNSAAASARVGDDRDYRAATVAGGDAAGVAVGQSQDVAATYTNTGTATIHMGTVAASAPDGTAAVDWTVGSSDACSGRAVAPGASCSTVFTATPSAAGARPAIAVFPDDTGIGVRTRDLSVTGITTPIAPGSIANGRSGGKVQLSWSDPGASSQRATSFQVLRGTSEADAAVIATVPAAASFASTTWTDPDTSDGTRYYEVRGMNAAGTGPATSTTLDLALRAPTNLFGTSTSRAGYLSWVAPTGVPKDPITGYVVYRGTSAAAMSQVATTSATSMNPAAIPGGTHAYFKVAAVTASGNGPVSSVLDVVGPTSQLVIAGADSSFTTSVSVHPMNGAPLSSPVVQDGQLHDDVAVSPNGVMVAYTSGDNTDDIYVKRLDGTGTPIAIATTSADEYAPAWSPDGTHLAYTMSVGSTDTVCKAPATGGAPTCVNRTDVGLPSWLDNATLVVAVDSPNAPLGTMTFSSNAVTPLPGTEGGYEPAVSPDGKKIAFMLPVSDTADALRVYTIATKAVVAGLSPINEFLGTPSWAHDGLSVYFTGNSPTYSSVYHSQADGGGTLSNVTGNHAYAFGVSVSTPDTTAPTSVKLAGIPAYTLGTLVTPTFSATDALNGVASYTVSYRKAAFNSGFGAPTAVTLTSAKAIAVAKGYTYCFSVKATDRVGNTSAATPEQCTVVPLDDRSLTRSTAFTPVTSSAYYAGTAMRTTSKGATLTRTGVTFAKQLYVVATSCSTCGTVDVLVGTARVGSINLYGGTVNKRVFALPSFSVRSGTVTLKVTSTGKTVIIDGLGIRK